jgi:chromosomal replication initiator protein
MSVIDSCDVSPSMVLQVVADSLGMKMQDYTAQTRKARHVLLRQMAAVFLRRHFPDMSLRQIGDYFGGREHTSVLHAIKSSESFLENQDELFVTNYKAIENQLFKLFTDEKANDKTD